MPRYIPLLVIVSSIIAASSRSRDHQAPPVAVPAAADTIGVGHRAFKTAALRVGSDTIDTFADRDGHRQSMSTSVQTTARVGDRYVITFAGRVRDGASIDSVFI